MPHAEHAPVSGHHAILGVDLVAFSEMSEERQLQVSRELFSWITRSLSFHAVPLERCRWSPGGDGGHLTFGSVEASQKAAGVAFRLLELTEEHNRQTGDDVRLRLGLHAGTVHEGKELTAGTNVWGHGINTAARITAMAQPGQVLISQEYYDSYLKQHQPASDVQLDEPYYRSVKHGKSVKVSNARCRGAGLPRDWALAQRWCGVRSLWLSARRDCEQLIRDAMESDDVVAALAAGKSLLDLDGDDEVISELLRAISNAEQAPPARLPRRQHLYFSKMPVGALRDLLRQTTLRDLPAGRTLFEEGAPSDAVFFPVSGQVEVCWKDRPDRVTIPRGEIIGETALWISDVRRTATVQARLDSLLLEVSYKTLQDIVRQYPHLEEEIVSTVQARTVKNLLDHKDFFPGLGAEQQERLRQRPTVCRKVPQGTRLGLAETTYVLFSGKARLSPPRLRPLELEASGQFQARNIAGVVALEEQDELIDGLEAEVIEDAVVVELSRQALLSAQQACKLVAERWEQITANRLLQLRRRKQ